jgi:SAM-dependent methyltransferase
MTILYSKLARIYHDMYQSIFDYKADFRRFRSILEKHHCNSVLQLGCGSGNLAPHFLSAGYQYIGLDIAPAMLAIARKQTPDARFVQGDMRRFSIRKKVDAVLIAGRSFTYMTTNRDVRAALRCIHRALKPAGTLILDNFEASAIFTNFQERTSHVVRRDGQSFLRKSRQSMNFDTGWTWIWEADYTLDDGQQKRKFHDRSVLRAFTPDELRLFLVLTGFERLRQSRQGQTMLTVAQKSSQTTKGQSAAKAALSVD